MYTYLHHQYHQRVDTIRQNTRERANKKCAAFLSSPNYTYTYTYKTDTH